MGLQEKGIRSKFEDKTLWEQNPGKRHIEPKMDTANVTITKIIEKQQNVHIALNTALHMWLDIWPNIQTDIRPDIQPDMRPGSWPDIRLLTCMSQVRQRQNVGTYFIFARYELTGAAHKL